MMFDHEGDGMIYFFGCYFGVILSHIAVTEEVEALQIQTHLDGFHRSVKVYMIYIMIYT